MLSRLSCFATPLVRPPSWKKTVEHWRNGAHMQVPIFVDGSRKLSLAASLGIEQHQQHQPQQQHEVVMPPTSPFFDHGGIPSLSVISRRLGRLDTGRAFALW